MNSSIFHDPLVRAFFQNYEFLPDFPPSLTEKPAQAAEVQNGPNQSDFLDLPLEIRQLIVQKIADLGDIIALKALASTCRLCRDDFRDLVKRQVFDLRERCKGNWELSNFPSRGKIRMNHGQATYDFWPGTPFSIANFLVIPETTPNESVTWQDGICNHQWIREIKNDNDTLFHRIQNLYRHDVGSPQPDQANKTLKELGFRPNHIYYSKC
jgi:bacterioferritin-associated ferredoxin